MVSAPQRSPADRSDTRRIPAQSAPVRRAAAAYRLSAVARRQARVARLRPRTHSALSRDTAPPHRSLLASPSAADVSLRAAAARSFSLRPVLRRDLRPALLRLLRSLPQPPFHLRSPPCSGRLVQNLSRIFPDSFSAQTELARGRRTHRHRRSARSRVAISVRLECPQDSAARSPAPRPARRSRLALRAAVEFLHRPMPSILSRRARTESGSVGELAYRVRGRASAHLRHASIQLSSSQPATTTLRQSAPGNGPPSWRSCFSCPQCPPPTTTAC